MKPDIYVWKARRCPVLIAALPPALAVLSAFPESDWKLLLPACTFCGLFMLVGQLGRDPGYQLQERLFESWGGPPTTAILRHRENRLDPATLGGLHRWLAEITGAPAPSKRKETASPADADDVYAAYVQHLRDATRDTKRYPLVFAENVNYGFRRNCLGLRPYAIALAALGTAGAAVNLLLFARGPRLGAAVAATIGCILLLLFWLRWVTPDWVRIPAQAYAERLIEAGRQMARDQPKAPDRKGKRPGRGTGKSAQGPGPTSPAADQKKAGPP